MIARARSLLSMAGPSSPAPERSDKQSTFYQRLQMRDWYQYIRHILSGDWTKPAFHQTPTFKTKYIGMLLQVYEIPTLYNVLAAAFTWILLAGYLVLPGTFTSLRNSRAVKDVAGKSQAEVAILHTVQNAPLLWVAAFCCVLGTSGMCWLWWMYQENYVWLISRIFL